MVIKTRKGIEQREGNREPINSQRGRAVESGGDGAGCASSGRAAHAGGFLCCCCRAQLGVGSKHDGGHKGQIPTFGLNSIIAQRVTGRFLSREVASESGVPGSCPGKMGDKLVLLDPSTGVLSDSGWFPNLPLLLFVQLQDDQ